MDPAGVDQQRWKRLEQLRETLLQGEQALAQERKDLALQQEDLARHLQMRQQLDQARASQPPSPHSPVELQFPCYDGNPAGPSPSPPTGRALLT